jgi:transcriptional regulator with XRE-family HTH domain
VGVRLRKARKDAGLTQADLAARSGVEQVTISKYEIGAVAEPSASRIAALAPPLGVSIEWLATGRGLRASVPAPVRRRRRYESSSNGTAGES